MFFAFLPIDFNELLVLDRREPVIPIYPTWLWVSTATEGGHVDWLELAPRLTGSAREAALVGRLGEGFLESPELVLCIRSMGYRNA